MYVDSISTYTPIFVIIYDAKTGIIYHENSDGSGKSTFTELLKPPIDYINADEIKKNMKCSDIEAAQIAEKQREEHLVNMQEFCFETVMSTERNLNLSKRAKEMGYFIRCYYVLTADPYINVYRVKARVASGGHDVPEEKIITKYDRALQLVKDVIEVSDICHVYDNSQSKQHRIFKKRKEEYFYDECEEWLREDIEMLTNITEIENRDLN